MLKAPVRAVTFDLWDCIFIDDSDEPKRAAAGEKPKPEARRDLLHTFLARHAPIPRETVDLACDITDAAYRKVWHDQCVTWTVRDRLDVVLTGLGRTLPDGELAELVKLHEEMELDFRPDPVPGVHAALAALKEKYKLGVVSDAIFSPGRVLRELLAGEGLVDYFDAFVFSDECGRSKPAPAVFVAAAERLAVSLDELVHIGDRPYNDVEGADRVGARAVLLTVVKDRSAADCPAAAVCDHYSKLPSILEDLDKR
ncbi:MAG: HAD family hydrolase [Phycisphaerales bacterium]|nr:MAG: HAD family hydrolase [Phycisphaerales bacterium]